MRETLIKICQLQPRYSSSNTPDMQERGRLINTELVGELRGRLPFVQPAFDSVFDDLAVGGSDGIGRKTEAPWVRLFSRAMSPNPREGFYVDIHFKADGSGVYFTLGCGSTIWSGGDLRPVSDEQLKTRTSWARSVIKQRWRSLRPFTDVIALGATAPLPKTFEKATALAKLISVQDLSTADLDSLLLDAAARLNEIYLAQLDQRDVSPGDQAVDEVVAIAKPLHKRNGRQGFGLSAPERRAVEQQAMRLAAEYLVSEGYKCQDTSATESFDLLATKGGQAIKVEVKGTTSDLCDSILMTRNEVDLHRAEKGLTGLVIVSRIKLLREETSLSAAGGLVEAMLGWDIDQWASTPIAFQVERQFGRKI